MSFLKKAMGVFVEFDENSDKKVQDPNTSKAVGVIQPAVVYAQNPVAPVVTYVTNSMSQSELEKFEKYFDDLFNKSNLPGPDYYEFHKMMETLEPHIRDERARISATFASLSIQGLTKDQLISAALKYKEVLENDSLSFNTALESKLQSEVGERQKKHDDLGVKIQKNSELVQRLTKEISDAQTEMGQIRNEIAETGTKLNANRDGYKLASDAMINKIITDIQKIKETI